MLTIKELEFGYPKSTLLFNKLDLDITKGHIYGLLGKNGAGKTTLLKIMCGLLFAKKGEVVLNGTDVSKRLPLTLQDMYLIPEEFYLPDISIEEYLKTASAFYPKFDHQQFDNFENE